MASTRPAPSNGMSAAKKKPISNFCHAVEVVDVEAVGALPTSIHEGRAATAFCEQEHTKLVSFQSSTGNSACLHSSEETIHTNISASDGETSSLAHSHPRTTNMTSPNDQASITVARNSTAAVAWYSDGKTSRIFHGPANDKSPYLNNSSNGNDEELRKDIDYVHRGQWVRAAILGANDGLVSIASLMLGVDAVKEHDAKAVIVSGLAGLVGGACSMAIGEFVSVYSQREAEISDQKKRKKVEQGADEGSKRGSHAGIQEKEEVSKARNGKPKPVKEEEEKDEEEIVRAPNPWEAAGASGLSFAIGATVPLVSAGFITDSRARLLVMITICSITLACMGAAGSKMSGGAVIKGAIRVLAAGWIAMLITFGLMKTFVSWNM